MMLFHAVLISAAFLCSLVAGFLFAFAAVVMPGIRKLDDRAFIRAFQAIDGVIQKNQPLFVLVWVSSVLSLIAVAVLGSWELAGVDRLLVVIAAIIYVLGVQAPTFVVNIPLNNRLQRLDAAAMDETTRHRVRNDFEGRWNRWNAFRAVCASVVSISLMLLLFRM